MFKKIKTADEIVSGFMKITGELEKTANHFYVKGGEHAVEAQKQMELHTAAVAEADKAKKISNKLNAFFRD